VFDVLKASGSVTIFVSGRWAKAIDDDGLADRWSNRITYEHPHVAHLPVAHRRRDRPDRGGAGEIPAQRMFRRHSASGLRLVYVLQDLHLPTVTWTSFATGRGRQDG
jgi:hypothetical protein